jgi:hypothetical protein
LRSWRPLSHAAGWLADQWLRVEWMEVSSAAAAIRLFGFQLAIRLSLRSIER